MSRQLTVALSLAVTLALSATCGPAHSQRYTRQRAQHSLQQLGQPGLVLGEFTVTKVIDGDTIKVDGLDSSLRLLAIDTEESYHHESQRQAVEAGWEQYLKDQRGHSRRPVKMSTPMGEAGKDFAARFLPIGSKVRLERDDPRQIRGRYNRYLSYVFAFKHGKWVNYNVEAVRAGMSPYFTKYGYSRRFDKEFRQAEAEARAAHRGIWDPNLKHYPDYEEREKWWNARADFVRRFEQEAKTHEDFINLNDWDAMERVEKHMGKPVTLLSTVGDIRLGDRGPTRVMLSRRLHEDFPLVFFDQGVFQSTRIAEWKGEWIRVRGIVSEYTNKHTGRRTLQIVVDRYKEITLSPIPGMPPPPGTEPPPAADGDATTATP